MSVTDALAPVVLAQCPRSTGREQQRHSISVGVYSKLDTKAARRARFRRIALALREQSKGNSSESHAITKLELRIPGAAYAVTSVSERDAAPASPSQSSSN